MSRSDIVVKGGNSMKPKKHKEADKVRKRVIMLRDQMAEGYFEMGRLLHRVSNEKLYLHWTTLDGNPYKNFGEYVEREVDFGFRKAKHLMSIWWYFSEKIGDPKVSERIKEIGWGKASTLVGVVNAKNVDKWMEKAKSLGVKELAYECRMALEAADKPRRPTRSINIGKTKQPTASVKSLATEVISQNEEMAALSKTYSNEEEENLGVDPLDDDQMRDHRARWTVILSGDQRGNVEQAIDRAKEMIGYEEDGKGFLLDHISTAFLAAYGGSTGNNIGEHKLNFRNQLIRAVESTLRLKIVAFDEKTMKPVFGENTIDRIINEGD